MQKKSLLILFIFSIINNLFSQNSYNETIYLKNGSIITGRIIEIVPLKSYTIQTKDNNIIVCQVEDIIKIIKNYDDNKKEENSSTSNNSKFKSIIDVGYGLKNGKYGLDVFSFNIINGFNLNNSWFIGFGTGFKSFIAESNNLNMVPVFVENRYSFNTKNNIKPYLGLSSGYGLFFGSGQKDHGFLFNPQVGLKIKVQKSTYLNLGVNYQTQQISFLSFPNLTKIIRFSESLGINLGIEF